MRDFRIGRLMGRFVVIWDDGGKRRRYRLSADTTNEAAREAREVILKPEAPPAGVSVAQLWAAYQADMGKRRQAAKLVQTKRNLLPSLGTYPQSRSPPMAAGLILL
jgi:hypothetical protein